MPIKSSLVLVLAMLLACSPEKKAQKDFKYAKYERTIKYYKGVLKKQPNNPKANYYIGEAYRLSNRIKEAEPFYAKAKGRGSKKDSTSLYYAKALQANGKYDEARKELEELAASATDNEKLKDRAKKEIQGLDYLSSIGGKKNYYTVKNLRGFWHTFYRPLSSGYERCKRRCEYVESHARRNQRE